MYHIFFIHSSVDEHLGFFSVLALINIKQATLSVNKKTVLDIHHHFLHLVSLSFQYRHRESARECKEERET